MSCFMQNTSNHPITLTGELYVHCAQTAIFSSEPVPKKCGNNIMFGGRLVSRIFEEFQQPAGNPNQINAALWRIFHHIKVWHSE
jgi:hypothetical protein